MPSFSIVFICTYLNENSPSINFQIVSSCIWSKVCKSFVCTKELTSIFLLSIICRYIFLCGSYWSINTGAFFLCIGGQLHDYLAKSHFVFSFYENRIFFIFYFLFYFLFFLFLVDKVIRFESWKWCI
jgi:hypothetical protein